MLVNFEFTDKLGSKPRPDIEPALIKVRNDFIALAGPGELTLEDWRQAGLPKESKIKLVAKTFTKKHIKKPFGHMSPRDKAALQEHLRSIFGI